MSLRPRLLSCTACLALSCGAPLAAQDRAVTYSQYGTPGLIEMPSAISADEGEIAAIVSWFDGQQRNQLTFQATERFSATFRYSRLEGYNLPGQPAPGSGTYYDRSFDLRYRITDEGDVMPAIAVGLQDFLGTGAYGAEYVTATKTFGDSIRATVGLGWGRFGSDGGFDNPLGLISDDFDERDIIDFGEGGSLDFDQYFHGDAALFGGVEYVPTEKLVFKLEYSSDAYEQETALGLIDRSSPFNFGVTYRPVPTIHLSASYLYGSELALRGAVTLNPTNRPFDGGLDPAPTPVAVRGADADAARSWSGATISEVEIGETLQRALRTEGVDLDSIQLTERSVRLRYTNQRYRAEAQAMGRIARLLTQGLPPSVETFTLEPMRLGIPLSAVTLSRSDIEALENEAGATQAIAERLHLRDAGTAAGLTQLPRTDDRFDWGISPYTGLSFFDATNPVKLSAGLKLTASYEFTPNLFASFELRQRLYTSNDSDGEVGGVDVDSAPVYPVRTDTAVYSDRGTTAITELTLAHYGRPGRNLYSRATIGYFERMYGGVSGEILWKPVDSRLGLGLEVNYARQREFDGGLAFRDYDVVTGHASAYYDIGNGFYTQVDAGRYLAGDWGATFTVEREFENGWRLGGYVTRTDISAEQFGEGSFDKGLRLTIPLDWVIGTPSRREVDTSFASLTRDGGSRVRIDGRLYDEVRDGHLSDLNDGMGRFWR
ncbi:YjbH domain-containing protein [Pseudoroseicyclus aestuarii]|uniref:Exopolysaccharide biosynthesis protein YbjH n=1 Tax=Pseudoroseicyclus aestuarii TaxID=1795041 RepID=A0A318T0H3_9RHOB|nr:YjbH domain-containing protein [Pseudoroseicyclus aestuarii]PYE83664.1 exopolysaccharide biosynthesis protein YbjH [Pseudoroseicyclus aestuarii]